MLLLISLLAAFAYSAQGALLARHARAVEPLSLVAYRGLSLAGLMWVMLFFVPTEAYSKFNSAENSAWPLLILAAICATIANMASNITVKHLTVGVTTAFCISLATIVAMIIEGVFLEKPLSLPQMGLITLLLGAVTWLGLLQDSSTQPADYNLRKGLVSSLIFGLFLGSAWVLIGTLSQQYHPFLVGYAWEATIGVLALASALLRGAVSKRGLSIGPGFSLLSKDQVKKIFLCSSPTLIGTGAYTYATTLGSVAIPSAILGTMVIFSCLFAFYLYGERISKLQWMIVAVVAGILAALKLYS